MNRPASNRLRACARYCAIPLFLACAILPMSTAAQEAAHETQDFRGIYVDSTAFPLGQGQDQVLAAAIKQSGV